MLINEKKILVSLVRLSLRKYSQEFVDILTVPNTTLQRHPPHMRRSTADATLAVADAMQVDIDLYLYTPIEL
jgi:hypothetical protein